MPAQPAENPSHLNSPEHLAYVIYTSGSTGKPKGVLIPHRGLSNFVQAFSRAMQVEPDSHVLQFASFSFDAAIAEIMIALVNGAVLYLAERETLLSPSELLRFLQANTITTATMPPSLLRLIPPDQLPLLTNLASVGEACPVQVAWAWTAEQGTLRNFVNGYGPTETTIGACWNRINTLPESAVTVPIGRPIDNTQVFVLDPHLRLAPTGVPGELCIAGVGLARGYLNRPDLSAQRFIPNPFFPAASPYPTLYRSGDLACWLSDANLAFLGRIDHQVKLRGFRIELGEIEATLLDHPAVSHAAVVLASADPDRNDPALDAFLAAFFSSQLDTPPSSDQLRTFLQSRLPAYMLPTTFTHLPALPLSPSGKIDRNALAALAASPQASRSGVSPTSRSPIEAALLETCAQLLHYPAISLSDNFFALGGHSLLATQLAARIHMLFHVELPLRTIFDAPSIAHIAAAIQLALAANAGIDTPPITPAPPADHPPLSFAQQRLWFLDQLAPGNLFYNIPLALRLLGPLDIDALQSALDAITARHASLRTSFPQLDGQPFQSVAQPAPFSIPVHDLSSLPEDLRLSHALDFANQQVRIPFDLALGPLFRFHIIRLDIDDHIALLVTHHIISDGWSLQVFFRELAALYHAAVHHTTPALPELPVSYLDFSAWQRTWLSGPARQKLLDFWLPSLANLPPLLQLPTDRPRPAMQSWNGASFSFSLPPALAIQLRDFSRSHSVTLFMSLLAAFQSLLYRYSNQTHGACTTIPVGSPIANRNHPHIENLIGFFVNTLVLSADFSTNPSFRSLLDQTRSATIQAFTHQDLPFEMLVDALHPQRNTSHTPLFQVMFVMDTPELGDLDLGDVSITGMEIHTGAATFDLTLSMRASDQEITGIFEYNTDLFEAATIQRMSGHLLTLLQAALDQPDAPIASLPILSQPELHQILLDWNDTAAPTPTHACAHQLFEAHAAANPDHPAILSPDSPPVSYALLNQRANQLAHFLISLHLPPESLIAISTDRSPELIVAILATLKAGAAFLPIDPSYPQERIAFMLQDSQAPVLLTTRAITRSIDLDSLPYAPSRILCLDGAWTHNVAQPGSPHAAGTSSPLDSQSVQSAIEIRCQPATNPDLHLSPHSLAYAIYTSGSTGKPKAALLEHAGLSNLSAAQLHAFHLSPFSRILQFAPISFDASVWEIFMALANGASLVIAPQHTLASPADLLHLLILSRTSLVTLPPSILALLPHHPLPDLATIVAAGEACPAELVQRWAAPHRSFFNAYGPTETTVCASMFLCRPEDPNPPPIGTPILNFNLFVLDHHLNPLPVGVPGELFIAGPGVARGYLNRPDLSRQRFIPNPFPSPYHSLYRSGDLVKLLPDGNIAFLGRIDHQVKLHGFRIELGEIEAALLALPHDSGISISQAAVLLREDSPGDPRLVAYLVLRHPPSDQIPLTSTLRSALQAFLPDYMIPSVFVDLIADGPGAMPLTPSAKIDRKALAALPPPSSDRPHLAASFTAPRSPTEVCLADICAELLNVSPIGVFDNFFELGGHSLLATQLISRIRSAFQIDLPLRSIFELPTIAQLAVAIQQEKAVQSASPTQVAQPPTIKPIAREHRRMKRSELNLNDQHPEDEAQLTQKKQPEAASN